MYKQVATVRRRRPTLGDTMDEITRSAGGVPRHEEAARVA
jgi:hypothetical protein